MLLPNGFFLQAVFCHFSTTYFAALSAIKCQAGRSSVCLDGNTIMCFNIHSYTVPNGHGVFYKTCQIWQVDPSSIISVSRLLCVSDSRPEFAHFATYVFVFTYKLFKDQSKTTRPFAGGSGFFVGLQRRR